MPTIDRIVPTLCGAYSKYFLLGKNNNLYLHTLNLPMPLLFLHYRFIEDKILSIDFSKNYYWYEINYFCWKTKRELGFYLNFEGWH
jgi:hypothetical protein